MSTGTEDQKYGMPLQRGTVFTMRGKAFIQVGRLRKELPGSVVTAADLRALGKEVGVLLHGSDIIAIVPVGKIKVPRKGPLCYVPAPELMVKLNEELRVPLLNALAKAYNLPPATVQALR